MPSADFLKFAESLEGGFVFLPCDTSLFVGDLGSQMVWGSPSLLVLAYGWMVWAGTRGIGDSFLFCRS